MTKQSSVLVFAAVFLLAVACTNGSAKPPSHQDALSTPSCLGGNLIASGQSADSAGARDCCMGEVTSGNVCCTPAFDPAFESDGSDCCYGPLGHQSNLNFTSGTVCCIPPNQVAIANLTTSCCDNYVAYNNDNIGICCIGPGATSTAGDGSDCCFGLVPDGSTVCADMSNTCTQPGQPSTTSDGSDCCYGSPQTTGGDCPACTPSGQPAIYMDDSDCCNVPDGGGLMTCP